MFNKEILEIISNNYPKRVKDIGESIGLLNLVLDELLSDINCDVLQYLNGRDYNKAAKQLKLHKEICDVYDENINIIEMIDSFVINEKDEDIVEQTDEEEKRSIPNYDKYVVDQTIPHNLYEDFEFKRPVAFKLYNDKVEASNWINVFQSTCELLYKIDSEIFINFINDKNMNGKKKNYFSLTNDNIRKPRKLEGVDIYIYIESNLSANSIKQIIIKMLKKYQIKITEYIVYFRADYTELSKNNKD